MMRISEKDLTRVIKNLKPNRIVLFIIDAKKYHRLHAKILKILIEQRKFAGIYITVNKPYKSLIKYLEENKINTNNIFFIDAISKMVEDKMKLTEHCLFIPSPSHLTDLGITLTEAINVLKNKERKFVIIDSLSTLLVYNDLETVARFMHFIISKLRVFGLVGILISIEKQIDEKAVNLLIEMCDEIIEVK